MSQVDNNRETSGGLSTIMDRIEHIQMRGDCMDIPSAGFDIASMFPGRLLVDIAIMFHDRLLFHIAFRFPMGSCVVFLVMYCWARYDVLCHIHDKPKNCI